MNITDRQKKLLFIIVNEYVATATPVGSKKIINKYMKNLSAATIRNDMAALEKEGLLEKVYNSSGRVPSVMGYKYFEHNNMSSIDEDIETRLRKIFSNRNFSINDVIDSSISLINETLKLPSVVTQTDNDELLKRIDLVPTSKDSALVILITSTGSVFKNIVNLESEKDLKNLSICIRIFNDRLIDCRLSEVIDKVKLLKSIIKEKIINYESSLQSILEKIFTFEKKIKTNVKGQYNLLSQPEFNDHDKLLKVLEMLENTTVWEQIAYNQHVHGGATTITFGDSIGIKDLCIASTEISLPNNKTQISIVGPARMDFSNVKGILDFIKNEIEKHWKKEE
ncbi:MAG: heat-inducible transcriptional repressor HrcA [Mycoplasmoidaceae bacterium]